MIYLTIFLAFCVFAVVLAGFWNLTRANSSGNLSQKLMRWRVGLQFVAIVITMLTIALIKH